MSNRFNMYEEGLVDANGPSSSGQTVRTVIDYDGIVRRFMRV